MTSAIPGRERFTSWRQWAAVIVAVAIVFIVLAATGSDADAHPPSDGVSRDRPECPHDWKLVPLWAGANAKPLAKANESQAVPGGTLHIDPSVGLSVPGPNTNIPEFHDCQKFISDDGKRYDSLFAVFASFRLDNIFGWTAWDSVVWTSSSVPVATVNGAGLVTPTGLGTTNIIVRSATDPTRQATVTVVVVDTVAGGPLVVFGVTPGAHLGVHIRPSQPLQINVNPVPLARLSMAAAEIYTYGNGYDQLGIGPSFSCLYVYPDRHGQLTARMIKAPNLGADERACLNEIDPDTARGKVLTVVRTPGGTASDYPRAARWDWDPDAKQYFIGIMCGNAWCEVGVGKGGNPFVPPRRYPTPGGTVPGEGRVVSVKGWYDEQILAVDSSAKAIPSKVTGTFIPDPDLGTRQMTDYTHQWVKTGYVALRPTDTANADADLAYYRTKFNFAPVAVGLPLSTMNKLSMCKGSIGDCHIPVEVISSCGGNWWANFTVRHFARSRWWVKIESAGATSTVVHRCVTRRVPTSAIATTIPPTARWRWMAADETGWEACTQGCCEVRPCSPLDPNCTGH